MRLYSGVCAAALVFVIGCCKEPADEEPEILSATPAAPVIVPLSTAEGAGGSPSDDKVGTKTVPPTGQKSDPGGSAFGRLGGAAGSAGSGSKSLGEGSGGAGGSKSAGAAGASGGKTLGAAGASGGKTTGAAGASGGKTTGAGGSGRGIPPPPGGRPKPGTK